MTRPGQLRQLAEQLSWLREAGYVEEYHLPESPTATWRVRLRGGDEMRLRTSQVRILLTGLAVGARGRLADSDAVALP